MNKSRLFFYFLSFMEGASVMAAELLGAKMLAPYFGTSLYVWSAVLAVTLGGLAAGYFAGGIISSLPSHLLSGKPVEYGGGAGRAEQDKKIAERSLYYVLLASAIFLMAMPVMAKEVMMRTARFDLLPSILISSMVFLFLPVFFMGMVSPLIVQCVTSIRPTIDSSLEGEKRKEGEGTKNSGKAAGTVYAVSTLGGILSTFLLGFYVIPRFGLTIPAISIGILLGIVPFINLIRLKFYVSLIFLLMAAGLVLFSLNSLKVPVTGSEIKILYSNEGLLGQIIVADYPLYEGMQKVKGQQRILFVNRSTQTIVKLKNGEKSFFEYVNLISERVTPHLFPQAESAGEKSKALVLGLGGGCVANALAGNNYEVDAIELDERMGYVAKKYFDLSGDVNICIDDARHYVRSKMPEDGWKAKNKNILRAEPGSCYQVVVLDAFIGEVNPHHLFTKEFFIEIRSLMPDNGVFFINGNGYWKGTAGKGMRSVCNTLVNAGFNVELVPTAEEEDYRNLVFIAKKSNADVGVATSEKISIQDMQDAVILTDEKPQLEMLNAEANIRWRKACMKYFLNGYYSGQDPFLFQ